MSRKNIPCSYFFGVLAPRLNSQQAALIKELRNQIESQAKIIAKQSELIVQLRDKLNLNSQNSSLPPSKDLYRIKNQEKPQKWTFLEKKGIDLTNNHAERSLRKAVLYRKKCLFVWSERGARFIERVLSLDLTCRFRGVNTYEKVFDLLQG